MPQLLRNLRVFHLILHYLLVNVKHYYYIFAEKHYKVRQKYKTIVRIVSLRIFKRY